MLSTGSEYDENGNIRQWWTKASLDNLEKRSKCFIDEYNNVTFLDEKVCSDALCFSVYEGEGIETVIVD